MRISCRRQILHHKRDTAIYIIMKLIIVFLREGVGTDWWCGWCACERERGTDNVLPPTPEQRTNNVSTNTHADAVGCFASIMVMHDGTPEVRRHRSQSELEMSSTIIPRQWARDAPLRPWWSMFQRAMHWTTTTSKRSASCPTLWRSFTACSGTHTEQSRRHGGIRSGIGWSPMWRCGKGTAFVCRVAC